MNVKAKRPAAREIELLNGLSDILHWEAVHCEAVYNDAMKCVCGQTDSSATIAYRLLHKYGRIPKSQRPK